MRYKAILQCCYKGAWFEPGDEVADIPQTAIQTLIKSGAVKDLQPPPPKKIWRKEEGGDD